MRKFGWEYETSEDSLKRFIQSRPKSAGLTEDEIMEELKAVRYQ